MTPALINLVGVIDLCLTYVQVTVDVAHDVRGPNLL
jgi:hypothetical protein